MADATVAEFAARAATLPAAMVAATPEAVRASGATLEAAARASVSAATGGDSRLSGVKRGGTITLDLDVRGAGRTAKAVVVPKGPIMLIENDVRAHGLPFRYKINRRVKKRGRKRLSFGGKVYAHVDHPGTTGKRPVRRAFQAAYPSAGEAGLLVFRQAIAKHLRGGR